MQSDQLTTRIPNYSPNNIEIGQQNDNDYLDDREEYLYQVDHATYIHTPTDHYADDEDTEPDNYAHIRQRKVYAPVCKVQPRCALLGYPFCNTAAHMEATPTREGI